MNYTKKIKTHHSSNHSQYGFTLIELIISITIAAIIMGISIPSFAGLLARNKVSTQTSAVTKSLYLARNYAIAQQKNVHVCHKSDAAKLGCHQQKDYNSSWANGWLVFVDINNNNDYDEDDDLIKVFRSVEQTNIIFNQRGRLRFFPNGSSRSAGFYICDQQQQAYRHVYLLYSGRARVNLSLSDQQKLTCDSA